VHDAEERAPTGAWVQQLKASSCIAVMGSPVCETGLGARRSGGLRCRD
jgi:hypothetical protein